MMHCGAAAMHSSWLCGLCVERSLYVWSACVCGVIVSSLCCVASKSLPCHGRWPNSDEARAHVPPVMVSGAAPEKRKP